jgi:integrase
MGTSIATVAARDKLKARHEPHFQKLGAGRYLGFQKLTPTSTGSWIARFRDPDTGKQTKRSLGGFDELPAHQRFDAAKTAAETWFSHLGHGGSTEAVTVKRACELYVAHVRDTKGNTTADDIAGRYRRWVDDSALGKLELTKARRTHFRAWRSGLAKTPAKVSRDAREQPVTRDRSPSTVNRDVTSLRAALNWSKAEGYVVSDMEWSDALKPAENADGRRDLYLDREQRRKLLEKAAADIGAFLRGMVLLPLRPGALASLNAGHFDKRLGVLTVGKDKAGRDRRITLPKATAALFEAAVKDKLPAAPLLARADGKRWDKDAWKGPVKEAAAAAELPTSTTAYTLRHSVITDLVTGGLDLLTVAQLSGTSVAMIERHYGHLRAEHAAAALASLAL